MEETQSEILNVDKTADLLKIPRSTVYKLAQQGKIPAKKLAGMAFSSIDTGKLDSRWCYDRSPRSRIGQKI
jgi:excisionase family DNA binding protein